MENSNVDPNAALDWRTHYHSVEAHDNVGPPEFLIDGILQRQAIMGIGAFIGQKKTLFALNLVWSLCSETAVRTLQSHAETVARSLSRA